MIDIIVILATQQAGASHKSGPMAWMTPVQTRISCHWQTRMTCCITANVLQTN